MKSIDLVNRLHQHRAWANRKLLEAAEGLSNEQLHRPHPIGQGSIWKTLTHLYAAEFVWLEALLGNAQPVTPGDLPDKLPGNQEGGGAMTSLAELETNWEQLAARWHAYMTQLRPESLGDIVYKASTSSGHGKRHGTRRADVLLHVCTHAQYTTAQVVNMLRRVGADSLPDVMLITLARQEMAS